MPTAAKDCQQRLRLEHDHRLRLLGSASPEPLSHNRQRLFQSSSERADSLGEPAILIVVAAFGLQI